MRRFFRRLSFFPVVLMLIGFVAFTILIAQPLRSSEKHGLVEGTIGAAPKLRPDGPFVYYAALYRGAPRAPDDVPEFPIDDQQPEGDGVFELSADAGDGARYYLLVRVETVNFDRYCRVVPLPNVERLDDGNWVGIESGKRLSRVRIVVDKGLRCG